MKTIRRLLRLLYPARCPYCGRVIEPFQEGCRDCVSKNSAQSEAFWINHPFLGNGNREILCCGPWFYMDKPKKAVLDFKFHRRREYAEPFGVSMARSVKENFPQVSPDLVCEIPLSKSRKRERGYDQSRLLAKELARNLKIPYAGLLEKSKGNHIQHELPLTRRWENVKGVYRLKKNAQVKGKTILLCDDIVTSGATMWEASGELLKHGAEAVYGVSFCRAVKREMEG